VRLAAGLERAPSFRARSRMDTQSGTCYFVLAAPPRTVRVEDEYDVGTDTIGVGAFGSVRIATCRRTRFVRALKTVDFDRHRQVDSNEIQIQSALHHPNVVRLFETFMDAKSLYLVMELCRGGDLVDAILTEAPDGFDEARAGGFIRQMLAALAYLHASPPGSSKPIIAHRDVKANNFMLTDKTASRLLKLTDFGSARMVEPGLPMTTKEGVPSYMAPEVMQQGPRYGEKCDVWSAGVVAFVICSGSLPFDGDDRELCAKVLNGSVVFDGPAWDNKSDVCKKLILQMLTVDASRRPSSAELERTSWLDPKSVGVRRRLPISFVGRLRSVASSSRFKAQGSCIRLHSTKRRVGNGKRGTKCSMGPSGMSACTAMGLHSSSVPRSCATKDNWGQIRSMRSSRSSRT